MKFHKNEEDQPVSLAKEAKSVSSLNRTRDTNNNKRQKNAKIPTVIIKFKT